MKKIKGPKSSPSNPSNPSHPSHPSHQTRPVGLAVMCKHWTPKGVCQVTSDIKYGNGQHLNHSNFIKEIP